MALDPHDLQTETPAGVSRPLLVGGVAIACLLGVGLGLWARPSQSERRFSPPVAVQPKVAAPPRSLEIVVDDGPAPIGKPLEVLAASEAPELAAEAAVDPPEAPLIAPRREPEGLVKVQAISPAPPEPTEIAPPVLPPVRQKVETPATRTAKPAAKAEKSPVTNAKAEVKAKPAEAKPKALVKTKAEAPKATPSRAVKAGKVVKAKAKAAEAKIVRSEEAAKPKIAKLVRVVSKAVPHRSKKTEAREAPERPAKATTPQKVGKPAPKKPATDPKLQKAALPKTAPAKADKPVKVAQVKKAPAKPSRCASADPGAALVCSTPALGAADREMARAYREAQAAGVPAWRLEQQQQRWLNARANAAREAPWAVRDVYAARIAELRDMSRSRQQDF
ncbi:hypothetical protein [Phenylobacterium deserti]|uniref:Lysozyme inhibitor LprI N-terminal domain-containing protein n=1 Tax=Phenylobacterium deserti TaxID=1914756 RepID=A0A328AX64_9CAUL|nr:hypothetical protein [Phenylobacterium deserti]RAK57448.1 hypothetical protein DJ018_05775 [Phenylobacterium deserti]